MVLRSMRRLRNSLPGRTTNEMCCNFPMSESSSCFVAVFLPRHFGSNIRVASILSAGTVISILMVSIWIPRYGSDVAGPISFSWATGMFKY